MSPSPTDQIHESSSRNTEKNVSINENTEALTTNERHSNINFNRADESLSNDIQDALEQSFVFDLPAKRHDRFVDQFIPCLQASLHIRQSHHWTLYLPNSRRVNFAIAASSFSSMSAIVQFPYPFSLAQNKKLNSV